jgi:hypothetical protein
MSDSKLRLVQRSLPPPRRHPAYRAQITVRAGSAPHGRSRPFALSHDALERLLATAEELERRTAARINDSANKTGIQP